MFVLLKGQIYLTVEGANIQTFTDETVYDGETYRNTLPAGYLGRAWSGGPFTIPGVSPALAEARDDNINLVAPHPLEKTRTRIVWTTTAGNFCGECWQDQYIGYSSAVPKYVSS